LPGKKCDTGYEWCIHLDSLLLSVLIRFRSRLYVCGRSLRLVNCNEKIIDIIRRSALEDYFLD
jgi:anti-anti-sigma regulatory factor